jgi:histidinol dehydrogenase
MRVLKTKNKNFRSSLKEIIDRGKRLALNVESTVKDIISQVEREGDSALRRLTKMFDGHEKIEISSEQIKTAHKHVDSDVLKSLKTAFGRIEEFHRKQLQNSWIHTGKKGEIVGQIVRPLHKAGIYVPGGKAVYPSSVLMNAIPANVAGVSEVVMATPGSSHGINPLILAAADMCGINRVFQIGGAQAVAALAYGTETVPRVDKIAGPGNIYVATAKRLVYGTVDIDMIAGPSEVLILSDGSGSAGWVAADMLSQAEHDEMASSILITTVEAFAEMVIKEIKDQLAKLPKMEIAEKSIEDYGAIIIADSLEEAAELANEIAPEHIELFVTNPWDLLQSIKNAGAVFMGYYSPESVGDYIAGPNHVLPTGGTSRFFSPLSVDDFIKKTSLVAFSPEALKSAANDVTCLARSEGLNAHAESIEIRLKEI